VGKSLCYTLADFSATIPTIIYTLFLKKEMKNIGILKEGTNIVVIVGSLYGSRALRFMDNDVCEKIVVSCCEISRPVKQI